MTGHMLCVNAGIADAAPELGVLKRGTKDQAA